MKVSMKRKTNNLKKLIQKIKKAKQSSVESGYFKEQGDHPYAGMSYVELATRHEFGMGNFPARQIRLATEVEIASSGAFKRKINKSLKDHFYKDESLEVVLDDFGYHMTAQAKDLFGIPSEFLPMNNAAYAELKGGNTPLVLDGYLMDAWSFRTTESPSIRGIP